MIDPLRDLLNTTAEQGRETHPVSDILGSWTASIEQFGILLSTLSHDYDLGDFCQGLTIAFKGKQMFGWLISSRFVNFLIKVLI
jgi:hypothetical protein